MSTISFLLPFPPSTNNLFVNGRKGRFRSQKYEAWIEEAGWELKRQRLPQLKGAVKLSFEFATPKTRLRRDISNLLKGPEDLLVKHGIIEGDHHEIVRSIRLSWSTEVEGMRVTIDPVS